MYLFFRYENTHTHIADNHTSLCSPFNLLLCTCANMWIRGLPVLIFFPFKFFCCVVPCQIILFKCFLEGWKSTMKWNKTDMLFFSCLIYILFILVATAKTIEKTMHHLNCISLYQLVETKQMFLWPRGTGCCSSISYTRTEEHFSLKDDQRTALEVFALLWTDYSKTLIYQPSWSETACMYSRFKFFQVRDIK